MLASLINFLRRHRNISDEDVAVIGQHIHLRTVKEGDVLLQEGKVARELFFISNGILKITHVNDKGNEVVLFFVKEDHLCTILNSFENNVPAHESILAASDATLVVFTREQLLQLYTLIPYFKDLMEGITREALMRKIQLRNTYAGTDASARYQLFLELQPDISLRVPLNDIASYLGITPQSLSRIRRNIR